MFLQDGGNLEKQKLQQKLKAKEWDEMMSSKKKMKLLEPVVKGCVWEGESLASEFFHLYARCLIEPLSKADNSPSPEEQSLKIQREAQCKCVYHDAVVVYVALDKRFCLPWWIIFPMWICTFDLNILFLSTWSTAAFAPWQHQQLQSDHYRVSGVLSSAVFLIVAPSNVQSSELYRQNSLKVMPSLFYYVKT